MSCPGFGEFVATWVLLSSLGRHSPVVNVEGTTSGVFLIVNEYPPDCIIPFFEVQV